MTSHRVHSLTEKRVTRVAIRWRERRPRYGRIHTVARKYRLGVVLVVGGRSGDVDCLSGSGIPSRVPIRRRRNAWLTYWRRLRIREQCIQVF